MTELSVEDFASYFAAVHGSEPFPWQIRLLRAVVRDGWPRVLDLPTGSGKTAALDVALFHLALEAPSQERQAPTRIILVVDRRTIVDQAFDRATRIARALHDARAGVLAVMRDRLLHLAGTPDSMPAEPLMVAALRGGMIRDDAWAKSPAQPLIVLSTVDQVGSRLLFRGYGVSQSMRPVHAGLVGNDALILLDEVHLAEPFRQTLAQIGDRYRKWAKRELPSRWHIVSMSATSALERVPSFALDERDRSHPLLRRRLEARKPARLVEVRVAGDEITRVRKFAERIVESAVPPGDFPGAAIAIVVNRVGLAHVVFGLLRDRYGEQAVIHLLTGRMRPLDRVSIEAEVKRRVGAGRSPREPEDGRPTIVVATQCIEAGADLDFDILVTECASFDALQQRFGRLNRLGESASSSGAVLCRADRLSEDDPIYGAALAKTWTWLKQRAAVQERVDFGIDALAAAVSETASLMVRRPDAPLLLPAYLDTFVQTSPVPDPDPDVSIWLHGARGAEAEVHVVWRADIDEALLTSVFRAGGDDARNRSEGLAVLEDVRARIELCPPVTSEAVSVRLSAARRWLAATDVHDEGDVEGMPADDSDDAAGRAPRPVVVWRGDESVVIAGNGGLRPGDTLVVPSAYGGLANGSWQPESTDPVPDIGDRAAHEAGRAVLRLHADVWKHTVAGVPEMPSFAMPPQPQLAETDEAVEVARNALDAWLKDAAQSTPQSWLSEVLRVVSDLSHRRVIAFGGSHYAVLGRQQSGVTTDGDVSSFTGVAVSLQSHLEGVGLFARRFAERCGLPADIIRAVELAGRWHDAGKTDPRFQRLLHGGNAYKAAVALEPLAKSALPSADRRARMRARERSGYPAGYRHELMSTALLLSTTGIPVGGGDVDSDLVFHLVASHHGWCRPLAPVAFDPEPISVEIRANETLLRASTDHGLERLDSGVSDRFFVLVRRYGWFGLAWLEAILRLADHRRSEWEQQRTGGT
jgi:CRISPR-associated endonuclease/helicase Cas3